MPIVLTIYISNPSSVVLSYDRLKVYSSSYEDGTFVEVSDAVTRPVIGTNTKYYNFEDLGGTSSSWYKTSYFNSSSLLESSLSSAVHGIEVDTEYVGSSYPVEISLTSDDSYAIDKVRFFCGDQKNIKRDYISPSCSDGYVNTSIDGYTQQLTYRGWPLQIIKDGVEYTSLSNPQVTDYSFVTFSGTQISTVSGVLDIWYSSFRRSDREILKIYNVVSPPTGVSSLDFSTEMKALVSAIWILKSEVSQLMGESLGSFNLQGELAYNPEPLLRQKREHIKELEEELKELVQSTVGTNLIGVRID